ncbi:MAG: hypothetical protein U0527_06380 [Candidatus Eisenbacteria bacterium]
MLALLALHLLLALLFLLSRASGTNSALVGLPLDDGWIHLVYARSLAEHLALQYNPGQWETGMTSPLWCILAAPLVKLALLVGAPAPLAVKLLSIATAWLTSLALFALGKKLTSSEWAAYGAALVPALEADFGFARVAGMEIWLAAFLLVTALYFVVTERWGWAGLALGLGLWSRPETALFALVLPLAWVGARAITRQSMPRPLDALRYAAPIAAFALALVGLCLAITGRPLPNTFYAKWSPVGQIDLSAWWGNVWVHFVRGSSFLRWGGGVALLAIAIARLARAREAEARSAGFCIAALGIGYPLLFALIESRNYIFFLPSPTFAFHRYFLPVSVLPHLLVGLGAGLGLEALFARRAPMASKTTKASAAARGATLPFGAAGTALAALGLLLSFASQPGRWISRVWLYSWNTRNIEDLQVKAARWLKENTAPDAVMALNDAGALRFLSGRNAVDLAGLNTHELAGVNGLPASTWKLLEARHVEWFAVMPFWYPQFSRIAAVSKVKEFVADHYTLKNNTGWDQLVLYNAPGGIRAASIAPFFLEEADRLLKRGAWDLASAEVKSAVECAPEDTAALGWRARLEAARGSAEARLAELKPRATGAPGGAEAIEASEIAYRLGDRATSAKLFEAAFRASSGVVRIRVVTARAQLLAQHKEGNEALALLERAARAEPHPLLFVQVGRLAQQGQRYGQALRAYRRALDLARDNETKAVVVSSMAELALASENRRLASEVVPLLGSLAIDPGQRARIEGQLRAIQPFPYDWR